MKKISVLLVAVFALTFFVACQSASVANKPETAKVENKETAQTTPPASPKADEHGHSDEAPRIPLEEAKKDFDAGNAVFVDTRSANAFQAEHIKGAINVPSNEIEAKYKDIPTGKKIIAYCS